nr:MAG TPA: hypothetical protein [Bacteriophage sp.]
MITLSTIAPASSVEVAENSKVQGRPLTTQVLEYNGLLLLYAKCT